MAVMSVADMTQVSSATLERSEDLHMHLTAAAS